MMMHTVMHRPSLPKCFSSPIVPRVNLNPKILPWSLSVASTKFNFQLPNTISCPNWFHSTKELSSPKPPSRTSSSSKRSSKPRTKKPTSRSEKNRFIAKKDNEKKGKGRRSKFHDKKMGNKPFKSKDNNMDKPSKAKVKTTKAELSKPIEQTQERKDGELLYRKVKQDENEMRLDRWIRSHCPSVPQSLLQRMIRKNLVLIEGRKTTADERVLAGQEISFPHVLRKTFKAEAKEPPPLSQKQLEELHSWILYKDAHVIALNKPPGLATQGCCYANTTLTQAGGSGIQESVDQFLPYLRFEYPEKPKLVHRLDKDTSGILLLGRTRQATIRLQRMIQLHKRKMFMKTYWALVHKVPKLKHGKIDAILQKQKVGNEDKVVVVDSKGGDARATVTYYSVLQNFGKEYSLMALYPETGRMHQLRVVCADLLSTPIVGGMNRSCKICSDAKDPKYGSEAGELTLGEFLKHKESDKTPKMPLLLHARKVECRHPILDASLKVTAPLPATFQKILKSLGIYNYNTLDDSIEMKK